MASYIAPDVLPGIWSAAEAIAKVAKVIIPIFILIELGIAIINYMAGGDSFPDFRKFYRHFLIWVGLLFYMPFMSMMNTTIDVVITYADELANEPIEKVLTDYKYAGAGGLDKLTGSTAENPSPEQKQEQTETVDSFWGMITSLYSSVTFNIMNLASEAISDGITLVIRFIIEVLGYLLSSILIILGPLAFAFNTAPWFGEGTLMRWFTAWLGIKCWNLTMSVLDLALERISTLGLVPNGNALDIASQGMWTVAINLSIVICYIMVPYLTNLYINSSGGGMMATAVRGGSMVAQGAKAAATKGASLLT